jgi:hypothetical protein
MKTFKQGTLLFIGLLLLAVTSCKKTDFAPSALQGSARVQNASTNTAFSFNDKTDIDLTLPGNYEINSCTIK